ncbi:hypothetical protein [Gordonia phthalatica]|uniref:Uncharacterized protein n=1 Tax=Gordonia phthalatica TaxID=1136941 RepID=A0A0N9NB83_9ACTN|nr:hypothetical protein [Gordonia phthalatica]ALG85664.1 hypothetical protein ACH46_15750 [Gordonia phthalatica]
MGAVAMVEGRERGEWIGAVLEELYDRADVTPWLTAVRVGGEAVTCGQLADAVQAQRRAAGMECMSVESSLVAAVVRCLPGIVALPPERLAQMVLDIVEWIGRDVPRTVVEHRSVG